MHTPRINAIPHHRACHRGAALLLVLFALLIATVLALTFVNGSATSVAIARNVDRHAQARAIAESGLEAAMNYIQTDADWRTNQAHGDWLVDESFGGGTFTIRGEDADGDLTDDASDIVRLIAIGTFDGVSHRVEAEVTPGTILSSGNLLFVVADASSLNTSDSNKRDLFQSWGYTVTLLSDNASSSEFNTALAGADVVFVSETVYSSTVGTKLSGTPVGVVCEEGYLSDELGISSWRSTYSSDEVDIVDTTHSITSSFSAGLVTIANANIKLYRYSGTVGAGVIAPAERANSSYAALAVLDTGDTDYQGNASPGRRVMLPWGPTNYGFDHLNDAGRTLVQRSLEWAANTASGGAIRSGVVTVGSSPQVVAISGFTNPVVVCTPNYRNNNVPIVARVSNVTTSSFSVWLQNPSGASVVAEDVHYIVVEAGAHEIDGFKFEAQTYTSTVTDEKNAWRGEEQSYLQTYTNPVVIGQVMSANDGEWSVFWSRGRTRTTPPTSNTLYTGKTVCEDSNTSREDETIGFIVFEEGNWSVAGITIDASLSSDSIAGVENNPPYAVDFNASFAEPPQTVVVSLAGMDGSNGGWAVLYGDDAVGAGGVNLSVDEDRIRDNDRRHTNEQAAVVAISSDQGDADTPTPVLIALYEFEPVTVTPTLIGHWRLDEAPVSGGGMSIDDRLTMYNNARIDSYDAQTAYGGANVGHAAIVTTNTTSNNRIRMYSQALIDGDVFVGPGAGSPSDVVQLYNNARIVGQVAAMSEEVDTSTAGAPSGMPSSSGNYTLNGGSYTISTDMTVNRMTLNNNATITIQGQVRIDVRNHLTLNNGTIVIPDGSSLELYVGHNVNVYNSSAINPDTAGPSRLNLTMYGNNRNMRLTSQAMISGRIRVPNDLTLNNNAAIYGSVIVGDDVALSSSAAIHLDTNQASSLGVIATDGAVENNGVGNGAAAGFTGRIGSAYYFDGDDDYVEIPHHGNYLLDQGAVSLWFRSESLSGRRELLSKDSNGFDTGGHLTIYTEGSTIKTRLQSSTASYYVDQTGLQTNTWYHVVVAWGPGGMELFLNGVSVDTEAYAGGLGTSSGGIGNHEPIALGGNTWRSGDGLVTPIQDHFRGRIDDVRLYDTRLDAAQANELFQGNDPSPAVTPVVFDTSGYSTAVDLTIDDPTAVSWIGGGGIDITADVTLASTEAATKLHDALTATDEFSIEVIFTPANITQEGPAGIASYSSGTSSRNFTLGQDEATYLHRLRTTDTNSNGTPGTASGDVLAADQQQHIIASFKDEQVFLYRNGSQELTAGRTGDLSDWDSTMRFVLGNEIGGNRPWHGKLYHLAIYDRGFNLLQAGNVFAGGEPGDGAGESQAFKIVWDENP